MATTDPTPLTDAEKTKARQAKRILYAVMIFFGLLPAILWWIFR